MEHPLLEIILIGLLTGTLIGTVGVGGILLTPLLLFFVGTELHVAQATANFSFLFTGIAGTVIYARQKSIDWNHVLWISIGIIPATVLGAKVNTILSSAVLTVILAALIMFSGYIALVQQKKDLKPANSLSRISMVLVGVGVGFGSSLTGTGGPVLLVPLLLFMGYITLTAVGISQAIQLPIAIFATIGFVIYGQIDFRLGLILGIIQSLGVIIGGKIAHALPQERLRSVVAITLIGVGLLMIGREFF